MQLKLNSADFAVFSRPRAPRKGAAEQKGILYAGPTNEQLAPVAGKRPATTTALQEIEGVDEAKVGKHAAALLQFIPGASGPVPATEARS